MEKENRSLKEKLKELEVDNQKLRRFVVGHLKVCPVGETLRQKMFIRKDQ